MGIHRSPVDYPPQRAVKRNFDVFFSSASEETVNQTIETLVIGDAIALIVMLL